MLSISIFATVLLILRGANVNAKNEPRPCPCGDVDTFAPKLWLDVLFVVDASEAVGVTNFATIKELMKNFVSGVPIGQTGAVSRVAVATFTTTVTQYATLTTWADRNSAINGINNIKYVGGSAANLRTALLWAENTIDTTDNRKNARNLVVLITAHGYDCLTQTQTSNDNPCQVAMSLTERGEVLQVIAIKLAGTNQPPVLNFYTPCYNLTNSADMLQQFLQQACHANCFCMKPFTQFTDNEQCSFFGECVYKMDIPVGYYSAQIGCQFEKLSLADIFSQEKQKFLDQQAGASLPYWTGMRLLEDGKTYMWENNGQKVMAGDYSRWYHSAPNNTFGGCPATEWNDDQSATVWKNEKCTWDEPSYFYFCQTNTCDTDHFCDKERI